MSYSRNQIREMESESIRTFLALNDEYLKGRVLDFGSGLQPYKSLVKGEYVPFEKGDSFPKGVFDTILMTQVIQYLDSPDQVLSELWLALKPKGILLMTFPTNWEEVDADDYWRFTKNGMVKILEELNFKVIGVYERSKFQFEDSVLYFGYGIVAQKS